MGKSNHLVPHQVKPGQKLNPEGRNQYTYRRDFELAIDELLKGVYEFRREVVEDSEGEQVRCILCNLRNCNLYVGHQMYAHKGCIDQIDQLTRGQVIALVTVQRAMAGDEKMLPTVLDRLWPKIQKHEVDVPQLKSGKVNAKPKRLEEVSEILSETETLH